MCTTHFTHPTVKLFHSSCNASGDTHATIQLLCLISNYTPSDIQVTWLVDGQEIKTMPLDTSRPEQEGKLASISSQLNITQGQWTSQNTYTCRVNYRGLVLEDNARNCPGTAPMPTPRHSVLGGAPRPHTVLSTPHRV